MQWVFLNDELVQAERATISIDDRGFLFGLSVYESIPVLSSTPFLLEEHVKRLNKGIEQLALDFKIDKDWLANVIETLCIENHVFGDAKCYIQVTAGNCEERNYHPSLNRPTVLVRLYAWQPLDIPHSAITVKDTRYQHCQTKSNSLLAHALAGRKAHEAHAAEAIFIRDGFVQECTTSNIFIVKDHVLYTPSADQQLVAGVTRDWVIEYAQKSKRAIQETRISVEALYDADEVFITASYKGIHPIHTIDDKTILTGHTGPVTQQLITAYANSQHQDHRHYAV